MTAESDDSLTVAPSPVCSPIIQSQFAPPNRRRNARAGRRPANPTHGSGEEPVVGGATPPGPRRNHGGDQEHPDRRGLRPDGGGGGAGAFLRPGLVHGVGQRRTSSPDR